MSVSGWHLAGKSFFCITYVSDRESKTAHQQWSDLLFRGTCVRISYFLDLQTTDFFVWRSLCNLVTSATHSGTPRGKLKRRVTKNDIKDFTTKLKTLAGINNEFRLKSKTRTWARPPVGLPLPGGIRGVGGKLACLDFLFLTDWETEGGMSMEGV